MCNQDRLNNPPEDFYDRSIIFVRTYFRKRSVEMATGNLEHFKIASHCRCAYFFGLVRGHETLPSVTQRAQQITNAMKRSQNSNHVPSATKEWTKVRAINSTAQAGVSDGKARPALSHASSSELHSAPLKFRSTLGDGTR